MTVVLLGPQHPQPNLRQALGALAVETPVAVVTAGWQEYEADDEELRAEIGVPAINLELHRRAEHVFAADRELATAYRARQQQLQRLQESYRVRLDYAQEAAHQVARLASDPALAAEEWQVSLAGLRVLDAEHLERCRRVHEELEARLRPSERDAVVRERRQIAERLRDCAALIIAGGHVAVLLNRLRLFDLAGLAGARPIIAWSAGAMALGERVVLFHDDPPQGRGMAEVLDDGLAWAPAIVPLPHARARLRMDDRERVALFAGRFAPAACVAMDAGTQATWTGERWWARGISRLAESGETESNWAAA